MDKKTSYYCLLVVLETTLFLAVVNTETSIHLAPDVETFDHPDKVLDSKIQKVFKTEEKKEDGIVKNDGRCPYQAKMEQILEPIREGDEFERTIENLEKRKLRYISATAYRGDDTRNYQRALRSINFSARASYSKMIREIGNNVYPLIIASESEPGIPSGVGGIFTLYLEDGSTKRISPTSPEYEMLKNLAHIPTGIFTIISPYFLTSKSTGWKLPLKNFHNKITEALEAANVGELSISNFLKSEGISMLEISDFHIKQWLEKEIVTIKDFEAYSSEMYLHIELSIYRSTTLQVQALLPELQKWKDELGERWKDVYALIPTVWSVSAINPRMQILSQLMSQEQVENQVFLFQNGGTVEEQRMSLGRILGDRASAFMILNTKSVEQKRLTFALSTKQDLMSNFCADAISKYLGYTKSIPLTAPFNTSTSLINKGETLRHDEEAKSFGKVNTYNGLSNHSST